MATTLEHDDLTVAEAAAVLSVDRSTVRRWIDQGTLAAYRVGQRSLRIRRDDPATMVTPVTPSEEWVAEIARLKAKRLTPEQRDRALAVIERARQHAEELHEQRGLRLSSPSWEILNELRDERSEQFS